MGQMKTDTGISAGADTSKAILAPLAAIVVGMFMVMLDSTAMNLMIPRLIAVFNGTYHSVQWAVTGYALAQAAIIPLAGWLSDRFGAKRMFLLSIGLFSIGSLLCAMAMGIGELVLFRVIQGMGGGMLVPLAFTYTYRLSPPGKIGAVMGIMGIPMLLAPALGPVLAGWLVDEYSWRWIFLINLPVGLFGVLFGMRKLRALERQTVAAPGWLGMVLAPLAFTSLSYGISSGGSDWGSPGAIGGLAVGGTALAIFTLTQLRMAHPLLELRVFSIGRFTRGIFALWMLQFTLFGTLFLIPQFLQNVKGLGALSTGLIMLPYALASGVFMQIGGRLSDKFGVRWLTVAAMAILATATGMLSRVTSDSSAGSILLPILLLGASMGLCMMPLNGHQVRPASLRQSGNSHDQRYAAGHDLLRCRRIDHDSDKQGQCLLRVFAPSRGHVARLQRHVPGGHVPCSSRHRTWNPNSEASNRGETV